MHTWKRKIFASLFLFVFILPGQNKTKTTNFGEFNGLSHHHCTSILQDHNGLLWISTWNGLDRYDGYNFVTFKSHPGDGSTLGYNRITNIKNIGSQILCQVEGNCYIFDMRTGKFHDSGYNWKQAMKKYHLPNTIIKNIIDRQHIVWSVDSIGLHRTYTGRKYFKYFPQHKATQTRCFFRDRKNRIWISSREDSTVRLFDAHLNLKGYLGMDGKLHKQYTHFYSAVYCIYQDIYNILWLGSKPRGLYKLTEKKNRFYIHHILQDSRGHKMGHEIYDIKQDKWKRLWLATMDKGLICIPNPYVSHPTILYQFPIYTNFPKECGSIRYSYITHDNIMLICTTRGLVVTKLSDISPYKLSFHLHQREANRITSLSNSATMYVMENSRHHFFVCTEGGGFNEILTKNLLSNQLSFRHFDESCLSSAVEDKGFLWFIGTKEIEAFDPLKENIICYNNDVWKDSLLFSDAHPLNLGNGHWMIGLINGCLIFNFNLLRMPDYIPEIVLTRVEMENDTINNAVSELDTLVLNKKQRNIQISFAALNYKESNNIDYRFHLDKNSKWKNIGKQPVVTLLNLEPGEHQLFLESKMINGSWAGNIRKITIIVTPTFWQTTLAKILYIFFILLFISGAYYLYYYICNIKKKQKEILEEYMTHLKLEQSEHNTQKNINTQKKTPERANTLSEEEKALMQKIINFVKEHLDDPDIGVDQLANTIGISKSGLNRKMKKITGITPKDFIIQARMRKASQLLRTTDLPIKEIAYDCGFTDQNYFGKSFKNIYNMSPTEYRQKNNTLFINT